MKRIVEFGPGYYEWLIYIDGIAIYYINDQEWDELFENEKELRLFVNSLIFDYIDQETNEEDIKNTSFTSKENQQLWNELTHEEKIQLTNQIIAQWRRYI